tara:strand:+ start:4379 stop:5134 length:756 start_codon:yes stop_codon:yes gene_type:complete
MPSIISILHKINPFLSKTNQEPNVYEIREYLKCNNVEFKEEYIEMLSSKKDKYKTIIKTIYPNIRLKAIVHIGETSGVFETETEIIKITFNSDELNNVIYFGDFEIGPKLRDFAVIGKYDIMIFEKMDGNLYELLMKTKNIEIEKVRNAVRKMHERGVIHFDLHTKNILYNKVADTYEFKICDYEHSKFFNTSFNYENLKDKLETEKGFKDFTPKEYAISESRELCFYDIKYIESTCDDALNYVAMRINNE